MSDPPDRLGCPVCGEAGIPIWADEIGEQAVARVARALGLDADSDLVRAVLAALCRPDGTP